MACIFQIDTKVDLKTVIFAEIWIILVDWNQNIKLITELTGRKTHPKINIQKKYDNTL